MDGAFIGLLTGGVIVLSGLLLLWRPDLMSPFIFMSKAELDKVDLKPAGKKACIVLVVTGVICAAANWFLSVSGHADAGIVVMVLSIVIGGIVLLLLTRKYDRNTSAWRYRFTIIFMALFFFVPNAIELRQQSFLWADDLSAYDDLIHWSTSIPLLGNHLSLFCLLFSATTVINQIVMMKQQDTGANPQMAAMKWMMYIMPVMFFFIFNEYASGLSYYYFISGLLGILTLWVMRRMTDEKKLLAQLEANKKAPSSRKPTGLMAKLEALQKEQERLQKEREERMNKMNKKH